jgi:hypothetical protein
MNFSRMLSGMSAFVKVHLSGFQRGESHLPQVRMTAGKNPSGFKCRISENPLEVVNKDAVGGLKREGEGKEWMALAANFHDLLTIAVPRRLIGRHADAETDDCSRALANYLIGRIVGLRLRNIDIHPGPFGG